MNTQHHHARVLACAAKRILLASSATLAFAGAAAAQIPSAPDQAPSALPPGNLPPAGSAANGSVAQRSGPDQGPVQTAPSLARNAPSSGSSVQEVIVTARRRNENVERVPVSITAFGSAQLADRNITSQADLQAAIPGLTVRATQSQNELNFSLRGQSVDAFTNSQPAVLSYVNDVQSEVTSAASFFDLDSIQVLKGPQGTLFGRNATGGAVLYTTAKPGNDLSGYVTGRLGNYDLREVQGALNLPAVSDVLLGRVAFDVDHQDGYIHNVTTGVDQGAVERQSFRGSLLFKPTSKLESITVVEYDHSGGNNTGLDLYSAPKVGTTSNGLNLSTVSALYSPLLDTAVGVPGAFAAFIAAHPGENPGGYQAALAQEKALGPFNTISESPTYHHEHDWSGSNTTTYQITPDLLIKNILGFDNVVSNDFTDIVGAPYPVENQINPNNGEQGFNRDASQGSEEFQIQGKAFDHQLNFIVGTYYGYEKVISTDNIAVFDITPIIQPEGFTYHFEEPDYTEALFFQGTYDLSKLTGVQGLSLTGGFRYTWEQLHFKQFSDSILYTGIGTEVSDYSDPSWTDGLEYQVSPTTLFYVENRGSWRTGGFNGTAPDMNATAANLGNVFLPETTYDVEGGMKFSGELFGRPTRLNLAAYNQWVSNVQRLVVIEVGANPVGLTTNVPKAEITGLELDNQINPVDWLTLGSSFAYTYARYTDKVASVFGVTLPFGPYADTPRFTGTLYGQVYLPTPEAWGRMSLRADAYAQSHTYFSNLNNTINPGTRLFGYALVNLRYQWDNMFGTNVTLAGYARNLGNQPYYTGGFPAAADFGTNGAVPGQPRMYGMELTYKFKGL